MYRYLLLLLLLAISLSSRGQVSRDSSVDFDQEFESNIKLEANQKVVDVSLFGKTRKGCLRGFNECKMILGDTNTPPLTLHYNQDSNGLLRYQVPPLQPNQKYLVLISTSKVPEGINEVMALLHQSNLDKVNGPALEAKAEILYTEIEKREQTINKYSNNCNCSDFFGVMSCDFFKSYFFTYLDIPYSQLILKQQQLKALPNDPSADANWCLNAINLPAAELKNLILLSEQCISCKDTIRQYRLLESSSPHPIKALLNLDARYSKDILNGFVKIEAAGSISPGDVSLQERLNNIAYSKTILQKSIDLVRYYSYKYPLQKLPATELALKNFQDCLDANYAILKKILAPQNKLKAEVKKLQDNFDSLLAKTFIQPSSSRAANTFTYNYTTRIGYVVQPDFGLMSYFDPQLFHKGGSAGKAIGIMPFIGFHVNFRPYNTKVPSRLIHKSFLDHLSFNSGVLVGSLAQDGVRTGLVGSTFLFTGFGYSLGHAVRIHTGTILYRKEDPNPLIDRKSLAATWYIGLSMDRVLTDIYKAFSSLF